MIGETLASLAYQTGSWLGTMNLQRARHEDRIKRVQGLADVEIECSMPLLQSGWHLRPWVTLTCSRLGRKHDVNAHVCRYVSRSMLDARQQNAVVVVAKDAAIERWACRAAKLFGVDSITLDYEANPNEPSLSLGHSRNVNLDAVSIFVGDRVDAFHVRPAGRIKAALERRVQHQGGVDVRVALGMDKNVAMHQMVDAGAIGWFLQEETTEASIKPDGLVTLASQDKRTLPDWATTDGQWLVHCTRAPSGPWPGQTQNQYYDELLLGRSSSRTPFDAVCRIARTNGLVAGAVASAQRWPVVCFSACPLVELMERRCYRPHLKRWDYEPYGVAIRLQAALDHGIEPVIYGGDRERRGLDEFEAYRFQARGKTYDWTLEREYRHRGNLPLSSFSKSDLRFFVENRRQADWLRARFDYQVDIVAI